jgi:hypothetical protein
MKETVLRCDWCVTKPRRFAIVTLALSNGRATKSAPTLDLCEPHRKEIYRAFKTRKPAGAKKTLTPKLKAAQDAGKAKHIEMWAARGKQILDFLAKAKDPVPAAELRKVMKKVPKHIYTRTLMSLRESKKIKREGWSKSARWSLV